MKKTRSSRKKKGKKFDKFIQYFAPTDISEIKKDFEIANKKNTINEQIKNDIENLIKNENDSNIGLRYDTYVCTLLNQKWKDFYSLLKLNSFIADLKKFKSISDLLIDENIDDEEEDEKNRIKCDVEFNLNCYYNQQIYFSKFVKNILFNTSYNIQNEFLIEFIDIKKYFQFGFYMNNFDEFSTQITNLVNELENNAEDDHEKNEIQQDKRNEKNLNYKIETAKKGSKKDKEILKIENKTSELNIGINRNKAGDINNTCKNKENNENNNENNDNNYNKNNILITINKENEENNSIKLIHSNERININDIFETDDFDENFQRKIMSLYDKCLDNSEFIKILKDQEKEEYQKQIKKFTFYFKNEISKTEMKNKLDSEFAKLKNQTNELKIEMINTKNKIKNLTDEDIELRKEIKNLKDENTDLKNQIKKLTDENSVIKNRFVEIEKDNNKMKSFIYPVLFIKAINQIFIKMIESHKNEIEIKKINKDYLIFEFKKDVNNINKNELNNVIQKMNEKKNNFYNYTNNSIEPSFMINDLLNELFKNLELTAKEKNNILSIIPNIELEKDNLYGKDESVQELLKKIYNLEE